MIYFVYKHLNPITFECFYVGIGTKRRAKDFSGRSLFWKRYVSKYGNPIIYIEKSNISLADAYRFEKELISFYGRRNNNSGVLVNLTDGGDGVNGVNSNPEIRAKQSESAKKRRWSNEVISKIKKSNKGQKRSDQTKKNIGKTSINRNGKIVLNTQTGIYYLSMSEARDTTNYSDSYIRQQLRGDRKNKTDFILV